MSDILRAPAKSKFFRFFHRAEEWVGIGSLFLLLLLPLADFLSRKFLNEPIPGSLITTRHLMLYITFIGGMLAAREGQHLAIGTFISFANERLKKLLHAVTSFAAVTISTAFVWGSLSLFLTGFTPGALVGFLPLQVFTVVLPIGMTFITVRFITKAETSLTGKLIAIFGVLLGTYLALQPFANVLTALFGQPDWYDNAVAFWAASLTPLVIPGILLLILLAFAGLPLFVVLGGIAWFLFLPTGGALETIPSEGFTLLTDGSMPAIPLFTLVGFILAEGKSAERLIRLFRAWFGWMPGGLIFVTVAVSAFFTTFTGASGVTILALGMILYLILTKSGYSPLFAIGLLTASGSIGILLPPSLPMILYGSSSRVSVLDMFLGGLIPGAMMIVAMTLFGVFTSLKNKVERTPFHLKEALKAFRDGLLDILLPVLIVAVYFSGAMDLTETAATAAAYAVFIQVVVLRDLKWRDLFRAMTKAMVIMGGILVILAFARGLSYYIVDTQLPTQLAAWVKTSITEPWVFLAFLNLTLLVVGMFMDIYSAIVVVAPLIIPMGAVFGIDPIHLGIIFLVNMEIGFLTPPVGLNLYLASYCFKQPLGKITVSVLPFLAIQLAILMLVTYVPWFSTALVQLVHAVK
ncbi:MAG: TRAP transporter large permease subunit [Spirochaetales bacterium]